MQSRPQKSGMSPPVGVRQPDARPPKPGPMILRFWADTPGVSAHWLNAIVPVAVHTACGRLVVHDPVAPTSEVRRPTPS